MNKISMLKEKNPLLVPKNMGIEMTSYIDIAITRARARTLLPS